MKIASLDWRSLGLTLGLALLGAGVVGSVRSRLYDVNLQVHEASDAYLLPPPPQVVLLSLGYRAALADVLWSNALVSQGLRTADHRRYDNVPMMVETINELDPTFRHPYLMADALLTFQVDPTHDDAVHARAILERGVRERPLDSELLLTAGQFIAMIGPASLITDPAEQESWRLDGARLLARAADIAVDDKFATWQALSAAKLLNRAGQRDAEIRLYRRLLLVSDDNELKERVHVQLARLVGEERNELFQRMEDEVSRLRHNDLPFVKRLELMVVGPARSAAACAGPAQAGNLACAPTWKDWGERFKEAADPSPTAEGDH